jgi:hypothetical protein
VGDVSAMLHTYLQDHHAGATAGLELARRAAGSNAKTAFGPELARIADEIAEDREALERVMEELGFGPSRLKDSAAWVAEKLGRLKPNNSLLSYSPLSRVVELEGLLIGVTGKLSLWQSLRAAVGESLDGVDFAALAGRATDQRGRLERLRERAAAEAFPAA